MTIDRSNRRPNDRACIACQSRDRVYILIRAHLDMTTRSIPPRFIFGSVVAFFLLILLTPIVVTPSAKSAPMAIPTAALIPRILAWAWWEPSRDASRDTSRDASRDASREASRDALWSIALRARCGCCLLKLCSSRNVGMSRGIGGRVHLN